MSAFPGLAPPVQSDPGWMNRVIPEAMTDEEMSRIMPDPPSELTSEQMAEIDPTDAKALTFIRQRAKADALLIRPKNVDSAIAGMTAGSPNVMPEDFHRRAYEMTHDIYQRARQIAWDLTPRQIEDAAREYATPARKKEAQQLVQAVNEVAAERGMFKDLGIAGRMSAGASRGGRGIAYNLERVFDIDGLTDDQRALAQELAQAREAGDPLNPQDQPWYKRGLIGAAETGPPMAASVGLASVTGGAGLGGFISQTAFWAAQTYPDRYLQMRRSGLSENGAHRAAIVSSVIEGAVENLEWNPFHSGAHGLVSEGLRSFFKKNAKEIAKSYAKEVSEEGVQSLVADATEYVANFAEGRRRDLGDATVEAAKNAMDQMEQAAPSLVFLMGPGAAVDTYLGAKAAHQYATKKGLMTPMGAALFAHDNPELAQEIASKKTPSRTDVEGVPLPDGEKMNLEERTEFARKLREATGVSESDAVERPAPPTIQPEPQKGVADEAQKEGQQGQEEAPLLTAPAAGPAVEPTKDKGEPAPPVSVAPKIDVASASEADIEKFILGVGEEEMARPPDKAQQARDELKGAVGELADYLKGINFSNPIGDPQLWKLTAKVTAKAVKAGYYTFAEYVNYVKSAIGDTRTLKLAPYLERAWRAMHESDSTGTVQKPGLVGDIIKQETKSDGTAEQPVLDGGPGLSDRAAAEPGQAKDEKPVAGVTPEPDVGPVRAEGRRAEVSVPQREPERDQGNGPVGNVSERPAGESGAETAQPPRVEPVEQVAVPGENFRFGPDDLTSTGGPQAKVRANLDAITTLKKVEDEKRPATPDEQRILSRYTGWGGVPQVFDERSRRFKDQGWEKSWGKSFDAVKAALTPDEWKSAALSTINAHYTSRPIIERIWSAVQRLGFAGGKVLEPATGVGHFFGLSPDAVASASSFAGVELDSISGRIAQKLYPRANIEISGLEYAKSVQDNSADLAISNVPFDRTGPADAKARYGQDLNLHNYFIARMIDSVRPGGLVVAITSHFTMDASQSQRKLLAEKADLIGAIRLPSNAFKANAGTEVTTDILFLRKPDGPRSGKSWSGIAPIKIGDKTAMVNEYFGRHPEMMLGTPSLEGKLRGAKEEFTLAPNGKELAPQIDEAVARLPESVYERPGVGASFAGAEDAIDAAGEREGRTLIRGDGLFVVQNGKAVPASTIQPMLKKPEHRQRVTAFVGVRDHYESHIKAMLSPDATDQQIAESQKKLNELYDKYAKKYGNLNNDRLRALLEHDPSSYYLVSSLEREQRVTDPKTGRAKTEYRKADVFNKRTIRPTEPPSRVDSMQDALQVSMAYRGRIETGYLASLLGKTVAEVTTDLAASDRTYFDPESGDWQMRETYLSGNVCAKLTAAERAAERDPGLARNVEALKAIQPPLVGLKSIGYRIGGAWIPDSFVTRFARETFGRSAKVQYLKATDSWVVTGVEHGVANQQTYGTARYTGLELLESALNLQQPTVYDSVKNPDGSTTRVFNQRETAAAQAAAEAIHRAFRTWVEASEQNQVEIQGAYNEAFNFWVPPVWDGSHLVLPGSSSEVSLRPHQKDAVWRMVQERRGLLAHAVGAGKTFEMIATAMELRRLGLANKPMIVVQNVTLGQFASSFRQMYPAANVLVASRRDLETGNRKKFLASVAAGDFDAIVVAQSQFDLLQSDPQRAMSLLTEQLAQLDEAIDEAIDRDGKTAPTVKELQKQRKQVIKRFDEAKAKAEGNSKEDVIWFDQLGVDQLFIDEAHAYKKPPMVTKLRALVGLNKQSSARAFNMLLKARATQERAGKGRGVVLATGTPITNTLGEAWAMQYIASPDILHEFDIASFDRFISTFAAIQPTMVMNAGGKWVMKDAITKFVNGHHLLQMIRATWDIVTTPDLHALFGKLDIGVPKVAGGKTEAVVLPITDSVSRFTSYLQQVYEQWSKLTGKEKREFSYIPVLTYAAARAASLDIRLVKPGAPDDPGSKINRIAADTFSIWKQTAEERGTQLIAIDRANRVNLSKLDSFLGGGDAGIDLAEEGDAGEDASGEDLFLYRDLVRKLVARGIPENEIAVIHDYDTDAKRQALFDKINEGVIRVLIGSTAKVGVGVNVQKRLFALHHGDAPWLPADLEQREGRIVRQGNTYKEVSIRSYGMEKTLDAAIFALLARKAVFLQQVLSGKFDGTEFEDPAGPIVLSAQEQMAALSGDPRVFQKVELENRLRQLGIERDAFIDAQARNRVTIQNRLDLVKIITEQKLPRLEKVLDQAEKIPGEIKDLSVNGTAVSGRKEIEKAIDARVEAASKEVLAKIEAQTLAPWTSRDDMVKPEYRVATIKHEASGAEAQVYAGATVRPVAGGDLEFTSQFHSRIKIGDDIVYEGASKTGQGLLSAFEAVPGHVSDLIGHEKQNAENLTVQVGELRQLVNRPFEKQAEFDKISEDLAALRRDMTGEGDVRSGLVSAFPGSQIVELVPKTAWRVDLPNGHSVNVRLDSEIEIKWDMAGPAIQDARGFEPDETEREKFEAAGSFELTSGSEALSGLGLIRLADGVGDETTIRHEALHAAKQFGMFRGSEWDALVKEYSKPGKTEQQQEEDVATAAALWTGDASLAEKFRAWVRTLLDKLGIAAIDARAVKVIMANPSFWTRAPQAGGSGEVQYSLRKRRNLANPATDAEARKFVEERDRQRLPPDVQSDDEVRTQAERIIKEDSAGLRERIDKGRMIGPADTLAAKMLVNNTAMRAIMSGNAADMKDAAALVDAYRQTGTEQAREFRQRRDPIESPAQRRARAVSEALLTPPKRIVKKIDEAKAAGDFAEAKRIREQWIDQIETIRAKLRALGLDLDKLDQYVFDPVRAARTLHEINAHKADKWDVAYEYWLSAILSGPLTQAANMIGNFGHMGWHFTAERLVEAVVNLGVRRPEGAQLGEFKYILGGILPGLSQGVRDAVMSWDAEIPFFNGMVDLTGRSKLEESSAAIPGKLGRAIRSSLRLLLAADALATSLAARMDVGAEAFRIAKSEGLKDHDLRKRIANLMQDRNSLAWARAKALADELTFKQPPGDITRAILNLRNVTIPGTDFAPLRYIMAFVVTPSNLFRTGFQKSALGSLKLGRRIYKGARTGDWRGITPLIAQQVIALAAVLAFMGNDEDDPWITGTEEMPGRGGKDMARRTFPAQSVKIDGKWFSYARIEPFATAVGVTLDWLNAMRSGDRERMAKVPIQSLVGQVRNKTFLSGLSDLLSALEADDSAEKVARWASGFAASWVPNLVRQAGAAFDDSYKERSVWGKGPEWTTRLLNRALAKTELGVIDEQPSYDLWGRQSPKSQSPIPGTDVLWRLLVPVRVQDEDIVKADHLLVRWNMKHWDEQYLPIPPSKYYVDGQGRKRGMTDEQYAQFTQRAGEIARAITDKQIRDENVESPTEQDIEVIRNAIKEARERAITQLKEQWATGKAPPSVSETAAAESERDFLAQADALATTVPLNAAKRELYARQVDEARTWINRRGMTVQEATQLYARHLALTMKDPAARSRRLTRFLSALNRAETPVSPTN